MRPGRGARLNGGALRIWVTRASPGAAATAERLRALGCDPLDAPLLAVQALPDVELRLEGVAALAFTSAAGVRAFAALTPVRDPPVFAVGAATAAAARAAGFARVDDADGDGRALAGLLLHRRPAGRVLAPGAREPAFDLAGVLSRGGVETEALAVYATTAVRPPPAEPLAALAAGALDAVLLQSASAARALEAAVVGVRVRRPPELLALSPACLPRALDWPARWAAAPRERDLLALASPLDTPPPPR